MIRYYVKRLLFFIPTLVIITLTGFILTLYAPGDPLKQLLHGSSEESFRSSSAQPALEKMWRSRLGLDLPVFYISVHSLSVPDTLRRISNETERELLKNTALLYGNPEAAGAYFQNIKQLEQLLQTGKMADSIKDRGLEYAYALKSRAADKDATTVLFNQLAAIRPLLPVPAQTAAGRCDSLYAALLLHATPWKSFIPVVRFHANNQYHRWLFGDGNWLTGKNSTFTKGIIRGDFGRSYISQQPIGAIIYYRIGWTLLFSITSLVVAYLVSIPLGIRMAMPQNRRFDRYSSLVLYFLYSLPNFFVATFLIMIFSNPDVLPLFPSSGLKPPGGYPADAGFFEKLRITLPYLVLPMIAYTYNSFAYLSRTFRTSLKEIMPQDYIKTAKAKGLSDYAIVRRHALRNALFPMITVFAHVLPYLIGGSVILETIFTIPGMGYEIYQSITNQNYPMIIAVFTLTGILTLIGFLISDLLYAFTDPRISYSR